MVSDACLDVFSEKNRLKVVEQGAHQLGLWGELGENHPYFEFRLRELTGCSGEGFGILRPRIQ